MFLRILRMLKTSGRNALVLWYACRHSATPRALKVAALALALYAVSPIDLIPDWIPVLGWMDDVAILAFGIGAILRRLPPHVRDEANSSTTGLVSSFHFRPRRQ